MYSTAANIFDEEERTEPSSRLYEEVEALSSDLNLDWDCYIDLA